MSTEDDDDPDELDTDQRGKTPLEQWEKVPASPMPPIAPDGGIAPGYGIGLAPAVPAATPANFVCLRGPCRHYWQVVTFMASGNPAETWGEDGLRDEKGNPIRQPRQINRSCLAAPGNEMELTDDTVYECSRWDPLSPREVRKREKARERYFKLHPEHRDHEEPSVVDDDEDDDDPR